MEWLYPENETPFKVDLGFLQEKIAHVEENKRLIGSSRAANEEELENRAAILNGVNSTAIDDWSERKKLPPYSQQPTKDYLNVVNDFIEAQKEIFELVDSQGFLAPDDLSRVHRTLVSKDEDIPARYKGALRSPYFPSIQTPYFDAVPGNKVFSELAFAFIQYFNLTGDFSKDIANIAMLHAQIARIQPFMVANKRMAFLVTNAMLKQMKYTPITLCRTQEENERYLSSLKEAILLRDASSLAEFFVDKELQAQQEQIDEVTIENFESASKTQDPITK